MSPHHCKGGRPHHSLAGQDAHSTSLCLRRVQTRCFIRTSCSSPEGNWGISGCSQSPEHRPLATILSPLCTGPVAAQPTLAPAEDHQELREHFLDGNVQTWVMEVALEASTEGVLGKPGSWKGGLTSLNIFLLQGCCNYHWW